MAYADPTPTDFTTRFPGFATVSVDTIQEALNEAVGRVDGSWPDLDRGIGVKLYAAHLLALDGMGASSDAQLAGFRVVKVGTLSIERDTLGSTTDTQPLMTTSYGRRFVELCRLNFAGPLIA